MYNLQNRTDKRSGYLTIFELRQAETFILKCIQREIFFEEISQLESRKPLKRNSKLISLDPFLDPTGLLRVGGRLKNFMLDYEVKHPIILPNRHFVTDLIITQEHQLQLHSGPQSTLYSLRLRYWPINGRSNTRRIIKKCVRCFRAKPKVLFPKMGDLPVHRVEPLRPFLRCGVDYAGPVLIKTGSKRSTKTAKAYVALFICFTTKAVHIELVSDLSSEAFLATFNRFVSRRGNVLDLYSDNGTNFVGANRYLKELGHFLKSHQFYEEVIKHLQLRNTIWHFISPRSPHMGGLSEAGIKTIKNHIQKVCGNSALTFEELSTLLARIEACVNSNPLSPMSENPNDLIDRLRQHFWSRWSREYFNCSNDISGHSHQLRSSSVPWCCW